MPEVRVPSRYRMVTRGEDRIEVDARSVRECLDAVETRHPGFRELLFNAKGELHVHARLFLNGEPLDRDALDAPVSGGDVVALLAPAAGG